MRPLLKPLYYAGTLLSLFAGVGHFFAPRLLEWYTYLSNAQPNIIVGVKWTNFFFSLLLTGISFLLILFRKKIFSGKRDAVFLYGFFVFVWFCRATITLIEPWPLEPLAWAAYAQQIAAFVIFILLAVPFAYILRSRRRER